MLTLLERSRLDARLTREQLAAKSGVAARTIRNLEGPTSPRSPMFATLVPLADALGIQPSELAVDFAQVYDARKAREETAAA